MISRKQASLLEALRAPSGMCCRKTMPAAASRHCISPICPKRNVSVRPRNLGLPKFRVKQLANHYYGHFDVNAEEFSDFPAARRSDAAEAFFPELIHEVTRQVADGGTTIKTLWRLFDGSLIESVLMRYPTRTTLCISSQVGCRHGLPILRHWTTGTD